MKKMLTACMTGIVAAGLACSTAWAAQDELNVFDDVPADHWAYGEIDKLAQLGIVEGYEDGSFRGKKVLNRYEMARVIGRSMSLLKHYDGALTNEDHAALEKLQAEFSEELGNLGVRVANLEKYKSNVGFFGDVRMRYRSNPQGKSTSNTGSSSRIDSRIRLGYWSELSPDLYFVGRLRANHVIADLQDSDTSTTKSSFSTGIGLDLAEAKWNRGKYTLELGRFNPTIGQGSIWSSKGEGAIDGAYVTYAPSQNLSMSLGYGSVTPMMQLQKDDIMYPGQDSSTHTPVFLGNLALKSGVTELTLGILQKNGGRDAQLEQDTTGNFHYKWVDHGVELKEYDGTSHYDMQQISLGLKTQLAPRLTFQGEYIRNNGDILDPVHKDWKYYNVNGTTWTELSEDSYKAEEQNTGYWLALNYGNYDYARKGTFDVNLMYLALGNTAIDSTYTPHGLPIRGGNGLGHDGERGWGLGFRYMLAPAVELSGSYFLTRPYDSSYSGFDGYKHPWQLALNFGF